jgi:MtN3 and saliva related transmembrane protein
MVYDLVIAIVGVGAAVCSMTSFAPQLIKIWREKDASSVSLRMYLVTFAAFLLWTIYGVMIGKWPIVGSNAVCRRPREHLNGDTPSWTTNRLWRIIGGSTSPTRRNVGPGPSGAGEADRRSL